MARSSHSPWQKLVLGLFLLLSLFNIATSTPLPSKDDRRTLVARETSITKERYEAYLTKYFPDTGHYIFYTGESKSQVVDFMAKNKGYNYYSTMFTAPDTKHPWYKFFDPVEDLDNAETSSAAMATKASGDVLVFGGAKYQTEGPSSFFTLHEIGPLHDGLKNGRVKNLIHMEKGATKLSQVFATEDANGRYTYKNNHKAGDDNATGKHGVCNAAAAVVSPVLGVFNAITCDAPQPNPKKPASDSSKPSKGMALSIVMHTGVAAHGTSAEVINTWKFYTTKANKAVGSCGETEGKEIKADSNDTPKGGANASLKKPPFPGGTFGLDIEGEKCTYKNDGATAGKLICPKREISCSADKMKDKEEGSLKCGNNQFLHAVVYCEF